MPPARLLIVDDDEVLARSLARLVSRDPAFELVGIALNIESAVATITSADPDLVVVDARLPDGGGQAVVRAALAHRSSIRLVVLSGQADQDTVFSMLRAGACAYLVKGTSWDGIRATLLGALDGHAALSPGILDHVVSGLAMDHEPDTAAAEAQRVLVQRVLDERRLRIEWQPIADLKDGRIHGAEALSRFEDDALPGPAEWFAAAKSAGLGIELEVLAAELAVEHATAMPGDVMISINASPSTILAPAFAAAVQPVLSRLAVEVTESAAVADYAMLAERFVDWRAAGARLAIDGTGAGLASLRHILELNPDHIKLDRTIISAVDRDYRRRALVTALVAFAREIGAGVVAEGIETPAELHALRELGVPWGQGWLLGRPHPLIEGDFAAPVAFPRALREPAGTVVAAERGRVSFIDRPSGLAVAAEHVSSVLAEAIDGASLHVAFLDEVRGAWRLIASAGPGALEPGRSVPLDRSPCAHVAAGTLPDVCGHIADHEAAGHLGLLRATSSLSYATALVESAPGQAALSLLALSREPGTFAAAEHDLLADGARVLIAALRREMANHPGDAALVRLRGLANLDAVSGVLRPGAWHAEFESTGRRLGSVSGPSALVLVRLDGLEAIRANQGVAKADLLVKGCARQITERARPTDVVGLIEPDTFGALLVGYAREEAVDAFCGAVTAGGLELARSHGVALDARTASACVVPRDWRRSLEVLLAPAA